MDVLHKIKLALALGVLDFIRRFLAYKRRSIEVDPIADKESIKKVLSTWRVSSKEKHIETKDDRFGELFSIMTIMIALLNSSIMVTIPEREISVFFAAGQ